MSRLKPNPMFHTPHSAEELFAWLERLPAADGVRHVAITAAMMAWNLAARLASETPDEEVPS